MVFQVKKYRLKIDFGFGRNGIEIKDIKKLKEYIEKNNLYFSGIYSHLFSVNYEEGLEIIQNFKKIISLLGKRKI